MFASPQQAASIDQIRTWFSTVDTDHSGTIRWEELQRALVNSNGQNFSEKACKLMIWMFRQNNEDTLNLEQFSQLYNYINNWFYVFSQYDTDKTGFLNETEMASALFRAGFQVSPELLKIIMQRNSPDEKKISAEHFIMECIQIQRYTHAFRQRDTENKGVITLPYEDFIFMLLSCTSI